MPNDFKYICIYLSLLRDGQDTNLCKIIEFEGVHALPTQTVFSGKICTIGWAASSTILHILLTDNYIHSRFQQNTLQRCSHVPTGL